MDSKYLAVAGMNGYAHFSLARRRWKLIGNETQVTQVIVTMIQQIKQDQGTLRIL